jgi:myosin heavy subunit
MNKDQQQTQTPNQQQQVPSSQQQQQQPSQTNNSNNNGGDTRDEMSSMLEEISKNPDQLRSFLENYTKLAEETKKVNEEKEAYHKAYKAGNAETSEKSEKLFRDIFQLKEGEKLSPELRKLIDYATGNPQGKSMLSLLQHMIKMNSSVMEAEEMKKKQTELVSRIQELESKKRSSTAAGFTNDGGQGQPPSKSQKLKHTFDSSQTFNKQSASIPVGASKRVGSTDGDDDDDIPEFLTTEQRSRIEKGLSLNDDNPILQKIRASLRTDKGDVPMFAPGSRSEDMFQKFVAANSATSTSSSVSTSWNGISNERPGFLNY